MFDDIPTKRPHFFCLIGGKKYFALKKCESRFRSSHCPSPRRQIQFVDRAIWKIARVIHNDIYLTNVSTFNGYLTPILFLGHVKLKRVCRGTDLVHGCQLEREVRRNHVCSSFCHCHRYRLTNTLSGARYQSHSPTMCSC